MSPDSRGVAEQALALSAVVELSYHDPNTATKMMQTDALCRSIDSRLAFLRVAALTEVIHNSMSESSGDKPACTGERHQAYARAKAAIKAAQSAF